MTLSVVIITCNEESHLARTLQSVKPLVQHGKGEVIIVDSGSTDRTVEVASSFGAKVFVEPWKGFAAQKNSAIDKAAGDWVLSLDADEELSSGAADVIQDIVAGSNIDQTGTGIWFPRKNLFLGRWIRHGGFYPDEKLRLFRRGTGRFQDRRVHETVIVEGKTSRAWALGRRSRADVALIHHSYPTLTDYIEHMNRYSSLGAEMSVAKGRHGFSLMNIFLRPLMTFFYNYFLRLGFLDGREGLLLHLNHAAYVSWKYAKAWESGRQSEA